MNIRDWLRFKRGVNPSGAHPMLVSGLVTAAHVYRGITKLCWVTSMCDGVHRADSFHYLLMAADLRTKHLDDEEKDHVLAAIRRRLGQGWDVILEHRGGTHEHIHMEWDDGRAHAAEYLADLQDDFYTRLEGTDAA